MNIAVVGTGYVGLVTGSCLAEFGSHVTCVDVDEDKIATLNRGEMTIFEPGLEEIVHRNVKEARLRFTTDVKGSIEEAHVILLAVPTPPTGDGSADLTYVRRVAADIATYAKDYKVVVTKSTVPMGTGAMIRQLIESHQKSPVPFSIASNPEFLREGSAVEDFMQPDRVVIGTEDERAQEILLQMYRPLKVDDVPFVCTDVVTSEMIKYASNAFLAVKISYINEMANLCEAVGADVSMVARGMGLDNRIGMKFLHPGPGYGGSCFPKDTRAIAAVAEGQGVELKIIHAAIEANEDRTRQIMQKIRQHVGYLAGRTLAFLGLSFKPDTDDLRESPSLKLIDSVRRDGASARVYDPVAMGKAAGELDDDVVRCANEYECVTGADALVLCTEWKQFRALDFERIREVMREPVVVDLRNIYSPTQLRELGFRYIGVGR